MPLAPGDLAQWLADTQRPAPVLLDVREDWEFEHCHIHGSVHVPMGTIPLKVQDLDRQAAIVCICHHGMRSMQVARYMQERGFEQIYNLSGGVDAWSQQVDPALPRY